MADSDVDNSVTRSKDRMIEDMVTKLVTDPITMKRPFVVYSDAFIFAGLLGTKTDFSL